LLLVVPKTMMTSGDIMNVDTQITTKYPLSSTSSDTSIANTISKLHDDGGGDGDGVGAKYTIFIFLHILINYSTSIIVIKRYQI